MVAGIAQKFLGEAVARWMRRRGGSSLGFRLAQREQPLLRGSWWLPCGASRPIGVWLNSPCGLKQRQPLIRSALRPRPRKAGTLAPRHWVGLVGWHGGIQQWDVKPEVVDANG